MIAQAMKVHQLIEADRQLLVEREHQPAARAQGALRLLQHGRHQPGDAGSVRTGRAGRADQHHRAAARRIGHRQGADRARDPLQLGARQEAVHQGQLRGAAAGSDRVGAVRLRKRRVHRRPRAEEGTLRAGRGRHALSRRNRRAQPRDPGEAAAGPAGARVRAAGRHADDPVERAARSPPPTRTWRRRSRPATSARISTTA